MQRRISLVLDQFSEFYAHRKGLLPIFGIIFIIANFALQLGGPTWLSQTNCLLHLGVILAVIGFMLARAL
jgi:hypothetical protein